MSETGAIVNNYKELVDFISENQVKFIDLRFTDTIGKQHHITVPTRMLSEDLFVHGQAFDGSSIEGWKGINNSDTIIVPEISTMRVDPYYPDLTIYFICDVVEPSTMQPYERCPRGIAKRAEEYLKSTGIGDVAYFGPEPEFFIFDSVTWGVEMSGCHTKIKAEEAAWSSDVDYEGSNTGHRPVVKGGYFPLPPVDSQHNLRAEMCNVLEELGIPVEVHHHEVATSGQGEIGTKFSTLVERADWSQTFKYVVKNTADQWGKTATFMPKPIVGDNGSGMHVHQSIWRDGKNLFDGDKFENLSQEALWYIGGIIKHARALNAITNPSTNSYKRLVPGFEAPVMLAYSSHNRSAGIRIPFTASSKARRIEARFPDPAANPYLAFTALLLAGIDGIKNKIDPGKPATENLYELSKEESSKIPQVCTSLEEALKSLDTGRDFLKQGGVFDDAWIDAYIELRTKELNLYRITTHPVEFQMYYSV